jgi:uncharacterized protein
MITVFADAFFWISLADVTDSAHQRAVNLASTFAGCVILTTDEVLTEFLTFFSGATVGMRQQAGESVRRILQNPAIRVVPQSRESFLAGLDLYTRSLDKRYSLTDCISMQTMRQEGITQVLTNDRHFEQEGFQALFRD